MAIDMKKVNGEYITTNEQFNNISHPQHYTEGRKYEPRKVIADWGLNFNLGNAVKYISRAGRKESSLYVEDLLKARQYIDFELEPYKDHIDYDKKGE